MTLLQIIQQVYGEMGFGTVTQVIGSQDRQVQQMLALLNRLCQDTTRQFDWQRLVRENIIITVASDEDVTTVEGSNIATMADTTGLSANYGLYGEGVRPFTQIASVLSGTQIALNMPAEKSGTFSTNVAQTQYPLPADWKKQINQTEWDRTNRWPLVGPQTGETWQSFRSGIVYAGPRLRFRILNNTIALSPPPSDGQVLGMEYISKSYVIGADGTRKTTFTADDDECIFDDSMIVEGLKVRFGRAKGLDVTFELQQFRGLLDTAKAQDQSAPVLSLAPEPCSILLSGANVPDGSWGH